MRINNLDFDTAFMKIRRYRKANFVSNTKTNSPLRPLIIRKTLQANSSPKAKVQVSLRTTQTKA